jgi:ABC-type lipoprotein export system ATPase subunit
MSEPAVELRQVFCVHRSAHGDAAALQGLDLRLDMGELLYVVGPSGAGKTTLLRVIAGLQTPSAGIANVFGSDIGRLPARARAAIRHRSIGFLHQRADAALAPGMTVRDAVQLPLALRGTPAAARLERVAELLAMAGLADRADALTGELSGGERQRVALCSAIAHRPALLLADEPTGELDRTSGEAIRGLLVSLAGPGGASVIVVSHDPEAAARAPRTVRIRDGRVVEDRDGDSSAHVVDREGWLRLPDSLRTQAGIRRRAVIRGVGRGLLVSAPENGIRAERTEHFSPATPGPRAGSPPDVPRFTPARIELREIIHRRGQGAARRLVLDSLSLRFEPGELTAVTGRSGVGKTTLLRLLAALERPDAGEVSLDGARLDELGPEALAEVRRARVGYLPQEPSPIGFMSASENIVLALEIRGAPKSAAEARAAVVLARLALAERSSQRVARLSAGESQRVALARALAAGHGLLVLDEPSSRLDQASAATVAEVLWSAAIDEGQTVICATHDQQLIARADHVIELGS